MVCTRQRSHFFVDRAGRLDLVLQLVGAAKLPIQRDKLQTLGDPASTSLVCQSRRTCSKCWMASPIAYIWNEA